MPEDADRMMHFPQPGGSGAISGRKVQEFTDPNARRLERLALARQMVCGRDRWEMLRGSPIESSDTAFIGPVLAELGHELMSAAIIRRTVKVLRFKEVVVATRPGRKAIWKDFATRFMPMDISCESDTLAPRFDQHIPRSAFAGFFVKGAQSLAMEEYRGQPAEFVVYGKETPAWKDVVAVHARSRQHVTMRNWAEAKWTALLARMRAAGFADRVVSIGTPGDALHIPGTEDLRGLSLERQMDVLRSARFAIGPSSGPMHLAQLCKCPVIVWCGGGKPERVATSSRYQTRWNPFNTRCLAMQYASWQPSVETVAGWVESFHAAGVRQ